jgi:hypothetical protein
VATSAQMERPALQALAVLPILLLCNLCVICHCVPQTWRLAVEVKGLLQDVGLSC